MELRDEIRLQIHRKLREQFPLVDQKRLSKNYYNIFLERLLDIAIQVFTDIMDGKEFEPLRKARGPEPLYNNPELLKRLRKLIAKGKALKEIGAELNVSYYTVWKGKKLLRETSSYPIKD